ncbi:anhydro-N-acetylmuramic acid kinase [Paraglaciecola sp. 2405UD69-4]|uniref:anhydro-N-acetylmuramic acid kinase n=1 Tax=Paraglaciecola sp. 2405UD69-4 TaxID=3391836 RepID=UPI0039C989FD
MHPHIEKLHAIANKKTRLIVGLMSGTSLDGLDIALCELSGSGSSTECNLVDFTTVDYCDDYRRNVKAIFAKPEGSLEHLCLLNPWVARYHAKLVNQAIQGFGYKNTDIDLIASHGQTIYHSPKVQHQYEHFPNATLQIGDGDHIAVLTDIITLSDFRQKHIAAGGQGAPLVMYGDYLLFHSSIENRIMLNIGGIANLTYLPSKGDISKVFSSDIGPGNTIMDAFIQTISSKLHYDDGAKVASAGSIHQGLLMELARSDFFAQSFPKTTGPEVFNLEYLHSAQKSADATDLSNEDVMATLCDFTAKCIVDSIVTLGQSLPDLSVYVSGGGLHNPLLMRRIQIRLSNKLPHTKISSTTQLSVNPDAKEAVLFALLANETLCATGPKLKATELNMPQITMGKLSFPD